MLTATPLNERIRMDPRISHALSRIHASPETADIAGIAAAVRLSPSRFAHLFRLETGVPPAHYVRALRMFRARLLIERTFLSIKEVMAHVGCNDPSHFTRDFRRFHGMPPRQCRAARDRRPLDAEPGTADDETAAVLRLAVLANRRHDRPGKPSSRARGPDLRLHARSP